MTDADLWQAMKEIGAVWEHSGNPQAPLVVLRNNRRHSNGFVDTLQFLSNVSNLEVAAFALAKKLSGKLEIKIDWVFGSPMAGIPFATANARHMRARKIGFTEKVDGKLICRFDIPPGNNFLIIEEMTTTGRTPQRSINAVLEKNPEAVPLDVVGAFLIRCDDHPPELLGREIISLVSLPKLGINYSEWTEAECPLCQTGSMAIDNCKRVWKSLLRTMWEPTCAIA